MMSTVDSSGSGLLRVLGAAVQFSLLGGCFELKDAAPYDGGADGGPPTRVGCNDTMAADPGP
jgi:hypothetical protein